MKKQSFVQIFVKKFKKNTLDNPESAKKASKSMENYH
jgi:hypothetical protein